MGLMRVGVVRIMHPHQVKPYKAKHSANPVLPLPKPKSLPRQKPSKLQSVAARTVNPTRARYGEQRRRGMKPIKSMSKSLPKRHY